MTGYTPKQCRDKKRLNRQLQSRHDSLVIEIANSWLSYKGVDSRKLDHLFDAPDCDDRIEASYPKLDQVLAGSLNEFIADLRAWAMTVNADALLRDRRPAIANGQMFAVPMHGRIQAMHDAISNDNIFSFIVGSFRRTNLATPDSNIAIHRRLVDPAVAATLTPGQIRTIADFLLRESLNAGQTAATPAQIENLLGPEAKSTMQQGIAKIGAQLILGMRTHITEPSDKNKTDFFTRFLPRCLAAELFPEEDDRETAPPIKTVNKLDNELSSWMHTVNAKGAHLEIGFGIPHDINEATTAAAVQYIAGAIEMERQMLHVENPADTIHVFFDRNADTLLVLAECGDRLIGPIDIPSETVIYAPESFFEDISTLAPHIRHHTDPSTFPRPHRTFH